MTSSILITNARVLDVHAGEYLEGVSILTGGDTIAEVGSPIAPLASSTVIDAEGRAVLPGFTDAHVHVTAATADIAAQAEWAPSYAAARSGHILRGMLERGFTTVRDMGGADYGLADALDEGYLTGPRLLFGGKALSQTGGHADMRHRGRTVTDNHPCCPTVGVVCDGVDQVRKAARDQLRTGAHHIKLMLSGGVASPTDRIDSTQLSVDEIRAAVEEAEAANRYVAGHAYTARAVNRALQAGVRSIEHGNLLDGTSVELFKKHEAFYVPTLVTYQALAKEGLRYGLPETSHRKVSDVLDHGLRALELAHRGGVDIVFGTDLLGGMHPHQSREFTIRGQVQPAIDVIRSATTVAARLVGMAGRIGEITPGAFADLVVVDGEPLSDLSVLTRPKMVVKAGQPVSWA
ncbi:amidohydrolase family protein [Streptomyces sp. NBC_00257]|uniref:metal-dependent hydrolase family protein n=1 Tax=unclassified Streptomyces TaxID=2593676 RepID=UPI00225671AF|nr:MULTISPECIES: amidohydrolase family protein [unclassified Streptomyces]MCX4870912.1 amidohydrolase family protein [Streptomyces sp. NBC_00906]MCX4901652.1 amidohydrolase family protein [Streptomyces sp. NBC_00892]MCX5426895.1 amidohydrolase family protein [Streptomyces sp. NBC_00062]